MKILKIVGYILLFFFMFAVFLYWTFPYNILKDRLISSVEEQLGSEYDVKIEDFSPSFFTGAVLKNVRIMKYDGDNVAPIWRAEKVRLRAGMGSLLFGGTRVNFSIKNKDSEFSGSFRKNDDGFAFAGEFDDFNIGDFGILKVKSGVGFASQIDGTVDLNIDKARMIRSSGKVDLDLDDMGLAAGELKLGEGGVFELPDIAFSKGSGSSLKFEISKGVIKVTEFKLTGGDLAIDVAGEVYMSSVLKNYRMNLRGKFSATKKFEEAVPLLFMVEKQKQPDGSYPINITGRLSQPAIKVGEFTLPF